MTDEELDAYAKRMEDRIASMYCRACSALMASKSINNGHWSVSLAQDGLRHYGHLKEPGEHLQACLTRYQMASVCGLSFAEEVDSSD